MTTINEIIVIRTLFTHDVELFCREHDISYYIFSSPSEWRTAYNVRAQDICLLQLQIYLASLEKDFAIYMETLDDYAMIYPSIVYAA